MHSALSLPLLLWELSGYQGKFGHILGGILLWVGWRLEHTQESHGNTRTIYSLHADSALGEIWKKGKDPPEWDFKGSNTTNVELKMCINMLN